VSEKVVTVSARISGDHLAILEKLSQELELSKTDVIQMALELLGQAGTGSSSSTVTLTISRDMNRRAQRMVHEMGLASSVQEVLVKALDPGLDAVLAEYMERRKMEISAAKVASEADAMELEVISSRSR
jgi:hypothetical protein